MPRTPTRSLGLVIPKPAARAVSPFVGPGPQFKPAMQGAAEALAAFAPALQEYQDAEERKESKEEAAEASTEMSAVVSELVGKTPEESEKAYREMAARGLFQQQSPAAKRARTSIWATAGAQHVHGQWMREAAAGKFNDYTDPETNKLVEGADPVERLNELKAEAMRGYGSKHGGADWDIAFSSAMASYQRELDYQTLKIRANDDALEVTRGAEENFSGLISRMGLLVIPKQDEWDVEEINKIRSSVQAIYREAKKTNSATWAKDVSGSLLRSLNVFRASSGSEEETLDVYEEMMKTPIGNKTLGQIDQARMMFAELER
ncbi:hypothetical protein DRQ25_17095, partial [Candidatus Fermentibacteria bacterium]